jgi:hypothetical protein
MNQGEQIMQTSSAVSDLNARVAELAEVWAHLPMGERLEQIELHMQSDGDFSDFAITVALDEHFNAVWERRWPGTAAVFSSYQPSLEK